LAEVLDGNFKKREVMKFFGSTSRCFYRKEEVGRPYEENFCSFRFFEDKED
jgi:hypothetical protein